MDLIKHNGEDFVANAGRVPRQRKHFNFETMDDERFKCHNLTCKLHSSTGLDKIKQFNP